MILILPGTHQEIDLDTLGYNDEMDEYDTFVLDRVIENAERLEREESEG